MKLREIGEFELIERMSKVFRREGVSGPDMAATPSRLAIGIGDDAAVWQPTQGRYTIATADAVVEGVHFTPATTDWYDLGWKAMVSNISDIAGMGGAPRYALAVLATNGDQQVDDILDLCRGMADVAGRFGTQVVGGDTVSSPVTMLSITVVGETGSRSESGDSPAVLSRSAAQPGYLIAVTGTLGSSAGGLDLLLRGDGVVDQQFASLVTAHRRPLPRVREGQLLVEAGVPCGMDMSDGLVQDLTRICIASQLSAIIELDSVPADPLLRRAFGDRYADLAVSGGEDYELLCLAPMDVMARAQSLLKGIGSELTVVGKAVERLPGQPPVLLAAADGTTFPPSRSGWEHFAVGSDAGER